ncbi:unnamed protein product, partial [marine sediment metagenome]
TSGIIYLHIPNTYTGAREAVISAGRIYHIPGAELLPWESLRRCGLDYVEIGPPGWEHLAVIVSDEPLFEDQMIKKSIPKEPLIKLTRDELELE